MEFAYTGEKDVSEAEGSMTESARTLAHDLYQS